MAYYVCSDLHGYPLKKFRSFLNRVGFRHDDFLFVLGDVIDRGSDGIKILKWLMLYTECAVNPRQSRSHDARL